MCQFCIGYVMERPSNRTEARYQDKQVNAEDDANSYSVFGLEADNSATASPRAYLLECTGVLLQLSGGEDCRLIYKLISHSRGQAPLFYF